TVRQYAVRPASQFLQKPQPMLKGRLTWSPFLMRLIPGPTSTTSPVFSWPKTPPGLKSVRPSYICRSEPQILVVVILMTTSLGCSILASGTFFTLTSRGPLARPAFMVLVLADTRLL